MKKKTTLQYFKLSHEFIKSDLYKSLSYSAKLILIQSMQFYYDDFPNKPFSLPYSTIKKELHLGRTTIAKAIKELINKKIWNLISEGSKNHSAEYSHNHYLLSVFRTSFMK
mgnify:CR=1 FL=1